MNQENKTTKRTLSLNWLGYLTILFIVLKATGVIAWSWWWVVSPILPVVGIVLAFFAWMILVCLVCLLSGRPITITKGNKKWVI